MRSSATGARTYCTSRDAISFDLGFLRQEPGPNGPTGVRAVGRSVESIAGAHYSTQAFRITYAGRDAGLPGADQDRIVPFDVLDGPNPPLDK